MQLAMPEAVSVAPGLKVIRWLNHPLASAGRVGWGLTRGGSLSSFSVYVAEKLKPARFVARQV